MSIFIINRAKDILAKHMLMGNWKSAIIKKGQRASRTSSQRGRMYIAVPPIGGWLGGHPETNGLRGRK